MFSELHFCYRLSDLKVLMSVLCGCLLLSSSRVSVGLGMISVGRQRASMAVNERLL